MTSPPDLQRWFDAWAQGRTAFHLAEVNPDLVRFRARLSGSKRVLVPLCGKSLDLRWLAEQGHEVVGVELVAQAVESFFREQGLQFVNEGAHHRSGPIDLVVADIFALTPDDLGGPVDAVWDRAALVAIEPSRRDAYCEQVARLLRPGGAQLLVTVEYDERKMQGPPFSIGVGEVRRLFGERAELLSETDAIDGYARFKERGLTALAERVWWIPAN